MGFELAHRFREAVRHGWDARWLLPLALLIFSIVAETGGEPVRVALRYARPAIADGELWRLITGHLVHLGWSHLMMNALALLAIWVLVGRYLTGGQWIAMTALCMAGIDLGFWYRDTQLMWYVGLSGVLHGLLAAGLVAGWQARRGEVLVLASLLVAKLLYEQILGAVPGSAATAGGDVVVNSHLYGALAGFAAILLLRVSVWRTRAI